MFKWEWVTGEVSFEPLSMIAADDPVTCAAYAKQKILTCPGRMMKVQQPCQKRLCSF